MIPATVTTASAMFNPSIGLEETQEIGFIFHSHLNATDSQGKVYYAQVLRWATTLQACTSPTGTSYVDNSTACVPR